VGGWYIERATRRGPYGVLSDGHHDHYHRMGVPPRKTLHPAVYVLTCAYQTLDKEYQNSQRTNSALDSLQSKITEWYCKMMGSER